MLIRLGTMIFMLAVFSGVASAHETMFGLGPRTIWNNGLETELTQEFEVRRFYFSGDNHDTNPRDRRSFMWTIEPALTYGISRDIAIRVKLPFEWMTETDKDGTRRNGGPGDFAFGGAYQFFNNPFPGGSTKARWFGEMTLPTGWRERENMATSMAEPIEEEHDGNWSFKLGLAASTSTTRHYFWLDLAATAFTNINGSGEGLIAQAHAAYAYRFFELDNYKDFDAIMLIEADAKFQAQGMVNGDRDENSGGYFFHLAFGIQFNITNRVEVKFGYNLPFYQYYFGRQFGSLGEGMLMVSYLF